MKLKLNIYLLKVIVCCAIIFNSALLFSQETVEQDLLINKAQEFVFFNPDESIKIANHLLKKELSDSELSAINLLMAKSYMVKGDYIKAVERIFEADANTSKTVDSIKFDILLVKAEIAGTLHLDSQFRHYLKNAKTIIGGKNVATKTDMELKFVLARAKMRLVRQKYPEALKLIDSLQQASTAEIEEKPDLKLQLAIYKGMANYGIEDYAGARLNLQNAQQLYTAQESTNTLYKIYINYILGNLHFQDKEYNNAIEVLLTALADAKRIGNIPLVKDINNQLGVNYLALNNKADHQKYNSEFLTQIVTVEDMETAAVNSMYTLIGKEQEACYTEKEHKFSSYIYIAVAGLVGLIIFGIALYLINKNKKRRLKEIISYLELSSNLMPKFVEPAKKEPNKKLLIPTETEQNILAKLRKFENSTKFTNKDMSLATLAAQLDVNTKYLSEVINKHYNDNFNTYINKLRINYIIEKLKNHPEYLNYKISYLAEESGFSSHSSFATIFKTITGIAPTTFIDLLGEEIRVKKA